MAVVGASVLVEYLAGGERASAARSALIAVDDELWAPHLVDAEVGHVIRRAVLAGELAAASAEAALEDLADLPLRRASHVGLLERAWRLRANASFYDALYIALCERLGTSLLTFDRRLADVPGVAATIDVIGTEASPGDATEAG